MLNILKSNSRDIRPTSLTLNTFGKEGKGGLNFLVGGQNWRGHPTGGWNPVSEY